MLVIYILIAISLLLYIFSQFMWIIVNYRRYKEEKENIIFVLNVKKDLGKNNGEFY